MKIIKKIKNVIVQSGGIATAKGKLIDYGEAHVLQYNFFRGTAIMDPRKLVKSLNAPKQDFEDWENSEGQYADSFLIGGYLFGKLFITGGSISLVKLIQLLTGFI